MKLELKLENKGEAFLMSYKSSQIKTKLVKKSEEENSAFLKYRTWDNIFTYEHLYKSYLKCLKGVSWKEQVQRFQVNRLQNLAKIYQELHITKQYQLHPYKEFILHERGKVRTCQSIKIVDRVVQKCLCDYCLTPLISQKLILKNFACQKNKGIAFARTCFKQDLERANITDYILLVDLTNYFASIDHIILLKQLQKLYLDQPIIDFIAYLLAYYDKNNSQKGLALGSQVSQNFALLYASSIDNYIYHYKNIKAYGRYMDDMYIILHDKQKLKKLLINIRKICNNLALEVNIKKTKIVKLSTNIIFLKEYYLKTNTKVYVKPNMQNIKKFLKKYKQHILTKADLVAWYGSFKKYKGAYVMNTLEKLISVEVLNLWQINI